MLYVIIDQVYVVEAMCKYMGVSLGDLYGFNGYKNCV